MQTALEANHIRRKQHGAGISPAPYSCHGTLRTGRRPENLPKPSRTVAKSTYHARLRMQSTIFVHDPANYVGPA